LTTQDLAWLRSAALAALTMLTLGVVAATAQAPAEKPNVIPIVSADFGYGGAGTNGGGERAACLRGLSTDLRQKGRLPIRSSANLPCWSGSR
jgi:hypothetical protein